MDREAVEAGVNCIKTELSGKKVLFITTKNLDYIRNTQEIELVKSSSAEFRIIGSSSKNYAVRLWNVYREILFLNAKKYDTVFIGFAPQLVLPFWKFKFRKNQIIIDFFISMYDTFVNDRKKIASTALPAKILKAIDMKTLRQADIVISDTKAHGKYFVEELRAETKKMKTLYLEADRSIYYPREIIRPDALKNKFVVLYFGSVLPLQGVDVVLKAYDLLKEDDRFYFYMIGKIGDKYRKPQSANIEYIDWVSQEKLAEYITMADLCLAGHFNKKIDKAKRTIPGKAYIYYAMGKKIILGDTAANHELFSESERISFVPMGNAAVLAKKISSYVL